MAGHGDCDVGDLLPGSKEDSGISPFFYATWGWQTANLIPLEIGFYCLGISHSVTMKSESCPSDVAHSARSDSPLYRDVEPFSEAGGAGTRVLFSFLCG